MYTLLFLALKNFILVTTLHIIFISFGAILVSRMDKYLRISMKRKIIPTQILYKIRALYADFYVT